MAPSLNRTGSDRAMSVANPLMRQNVHTRRVLIVSAALLMAILLPVTVLFSLEASDEDSGKNAELGAPISPLLTSPAPAWTEDATRSASMVVVGTLLIGLGAVVRRTA
jgi:hypothetical protein